VNNVVRREMGVRKASFARAEPTVQLTGMEIGGVTPFGLPPHLPVLVDGRVMEPDWIVLGGGNRSSKLRIAPDTLREVAAVRVVEGLATNRG
jgi:prolyl-tRNA editing enzyme YbaK/EbsC (Cys-tRNA(Pro) deacylase)